jgi:S1-C subfamily serine protease
MVQHAIDDQGAHIRAKTTRVDGKPAGIRLTGVSGLGVGLRDGDVIVAVEGEPALDEDAATDIALSTILHGGSTLRATAMRGSRLVAITAELPPAPPPPEAAGKAR